MTSIPMGKDRFLPIIALIILAVASSASIYVYATQTTSETIQINGQQYTVDQLFTMTNPRTFTDLNVSGVALDDLMIKTGVTNPATHTYTIIASDGYQKTVTWDNMKNGLLTKEMKTFFTDLPKAFQVKGVVTIEVK